LIGIKETHFTAGLSYSYMDRIGGEYSFGAENGICVIWGNYGSCEVAVGMVFDGF